MGDCNKATYSGYTKGTPQNYLLDSGAIFKNFVFGVDTYASAKAAGKLLGATDGGSSFSVVADMREEEVDGVKGAYRGGTVFNNWTVEMTANFKETSLEILKAALTNAQVDTTTYDEYDKITAGNYICDEDYYDNITFVGKIQGASQPIVIQITNALGTGGLGFATAKNTVAKHAITFKGHYDEDNLDNPPFELFLPKMTGTVSGYVSTGAAAQGTLTVDTLPTATTDTITVGATTYTFVAEADYEEAGQISLGAGLAECQANIVAAINGTDLYNAVNDDVSAGDFAADDCILTATVPGIDGNTITTTETFTAATNIFDGTTLGTTIAGSGTPQEGATVSIVVGSTTYTAVTNATGGFTRLNTPYGVRTVTADKSALTGSTSATIVGGKNTDVGVIIVS